MLGHKTRDFKQHESISLEDLVPECNFYRQVERSIDLSFVCELADEFYSSMGRPSIDPVVFFKLQLIAFFEGIRSERRLMETVNLNLAHRCIVFSDRDLKIFPHIVTRRYVGVCRRIRRQVERASRHISSRYSGKFINRFCSPLIGIFLSAWRET